jgi:hypothetical protein
VIGLIFEGVTGCVVTVGKVRRRNSA